MDSLQAKEINLNKSPLLLPKLEYVIVQYIILKSGILEINSFNIAL